MPIGYVLYLCLYAIIIFLVIKFEDKEEIVFGLFLSSLLYLLFLVLNLGIWTFVYEFTKETYSQESVYKIISLERDSSFNGQFYLGSGYVNSELNYLVYVQVEDGVYKLHQLDTSKSKLKLTDNQEPCVIQTSYYSHSDIVYKLFNNKDNYEYSTYLIVVPTKTIIKEFKG